MAKVVLTADSRNPVGSVVERLAGRFTDLRPAYRKVVSEWRALIRQEFQTGRWRPPSGSPRPWPDRKPFGDRPGGPSRLQESGTLLSAWMGGAGAVERITRQGGVFGVTGIPYAVVHRGGAGDVRVADARRMFRIAVTQRMFMFLGIVKGVWLSPKKRREGILIPARPHATVNPEIRTRAAAIVSAQIVGRPLPEFGGAA